MPLTRRYHYAHRRHHYPYRRVHRVSTGFRPSFSPTPRLPLHRRKELAAALSSYHYSSAQKPETKYLDGTAANGGVGAYPATWSRYDLSCGITQGVTNISRTGNEVCSKSLGMTFNLVRNPSGATVQRVRYMLIDYVDSDGSIVAAADLFLSTGVFLPQRDLQWASSFSVLLDRIVTLDSASKNSQTVRIRRKLIRRMKYQDNSGTTGGQITHQLFFVIWSDQVSNTPTIESPSWRLTFTDM